MKNSHPNLHAITSLIASKFIDRDGIRRTYERYRYDRKEQAVGIGNAVVSGLNSTGYNVALMTYRVSGKWKIAVIPTCESAE